MARILLNAAVLETIVLTAAAARNDGKTWKEVFAVAKKAGFLGSSSTLQKLVRAQPLGGKIVRPVGNKNTVKAADTNRAAVAPENIRADETPESIHNRLPVLRYGVQYPRPISLFDGDFQHSRDGELVASSRILDKVEAVCVVNSHSSDPRGADILVDSTLNPPGSFLTVIHAAARMSTGDSTALGIGTQIPVQRRLDGTAFVAIRGLAPAASLVLSNCPQACIDARA